MKLLPKADCEEPFIQYHRDNWHSQHQKNSEVLQNIEGLQADMFRKIIEKNQENVDEAKRKGRE